jgi:iron complex transport system permease protein
MSRNLTIRLDRGNVSLRLDIRTLTILVIVLALLGLALAATAAFGEIPFSLWDVVQAVFGQGSHLAQLVVREFRLPRALEGALIGGMLGLSGAMFQRLVQNPLVAPDIIGVNQGAALAAVAVIILGANQNILPLAAFGGGMAAATAGFLLSLRRGLSPYRLVLVGIAINALLGAVMSFILTIPAVGEAASARLSEALDWLYGSLDSALWSQVRLLAVVFAILLPVALILGRALDLLALGEDTARSLSLRVGWTRVAVVMVGVLLAATAVSMAGPIGFIAFIAPHIARRIARNSANGSLALSAGVGALLLVVADYIAKRILEPTQLPTGLVTIFLGAPYFLALLYRGGRQGNIM